VKAFDFAYLETCVTVNHTVGRYAFWAAARDASLGGGRPAWNPTSDQVATWLEQDEGVLLYNLRQFCSAKKWNKLVKRVRAFGPEHDTPEEIMERLCTSVCAR
jgi:hypothetical protein